MKSQPVTLNKGNKMPEQQTEWKPKPEGSFWTYQFVRKGTGVFLCEVYYSDGKPDLYNDRLPIFYVEGMGEGKEGVRSALSKMATAFHKPTLDENIFKGWP
jgi:hypothetical protein